MERSIPQEAWDSDYYMFNEHTAQTKRVKFIVFSNRWQEPRIERYDKRVGKDEQGSPLDVDYMYLKEKLFHAFIPTDKNEEHFEIHQNRKEHGEKCGDTFIPGVWDILEEMKTNETLKQYDCFFFIFLTYMATDSKNGGMNIAVCQGSISLDKIWDKVSEIDIMNGMPKVFLVQADDVKLMKDAQTITKGGVAPFKEVERKIPTDADRLSIVCTIPGKFFVEKENSPSFLIQAFVETLLENKEEDLLTLSVLINERVANLISKSTKKHCIHYTNQLAIPCTTSTLRKLLVMKF